MAALSLRLGVDVRSADQNIMMPLDQGVYWIFGNER